MICAFIGAGFGNYVRAKMNQHKITLFAGIFVSVAVACLMYMVSFRGIEALFSVSSRHEAGYIGAMLFVIPGFPFITSGLDIAKLDMRSGLERMAHALTIIIVATLVGWLTAMSINFKPEDFIPLQLTSWQLLALRLPASFCGVFGFSLMFNSSPKLASTAGIIGALANTLRLELVDFTNVPPAAAACWSLAGGLVSFDLRQKSRLPPHFFDSTCDRDHGPGALYVSSGVQHRLKLDQCGGILVDPSDLDRLGFTIGLDRSSDLDGSKMAV